MNGSFASDAMIWARNDLPVPGAPDRSMPFGISPPALLEGLDAAQDLDGRPGVLQEVGLTR